MSDRPGKVCPRCARPLPPEAGADICPRCAVDFLQGSQTDLGESFQTRLPKFTPPTVAELSPLFPNLDIIELIGRGGMGAVYKARQRELDRFVALKILPPGIGHDPAFAGRFVREAKALARLSHPGIVTVHDFGRVEGAKWPSPQAEADSGPSASEPKPVELFYLLMEFVDGVTLRHLLHSGRMAAREALAIVPQICEALQFAHDHGIVHRDIKPENILLDRLGRVKVADFGLAKLVGIEVAANPMPNACESTPRGASNRHLPDSALSDAGRIMGTPQYMAPEQKDRPREVDHRADIYALGVVFYQMLTGELPEQQLAPPSHKVQIDVRLDEIVLKALQKEPNRRYQQVSQVKEVIETLIGESDGDLGKPRIKYAPQAGIWVGKKFSFPALLALSGLSLVASFLVQAKIPTWLLVRLVDPLGIAPKVASWVLNDAAISVAGYGVFQAFAGFLAAMEIRASRYYRLCLLGSLVAVFSPLFFPLGQIFGVFLTYQLVKSNRTSWSVRTTLAAYPQWLHLLDNFNLLRAIALGMAIVGWVAEMTAENIPVIAASDAADKAILGHLARNLLPIASAIFGLLAVNLLQTTERGIRDRALAIFPSALLFTRRVLEPSTTFFGSAEFAAIVYVLCVAALLTIFAAVTTNSFTRGVLIRNRRDKLRLISGVIFSVHAVVIAISCVSEARSLHSKSSGVANSRSSLLESSNDRLYFNAVRDFSTVTNPVGSWTYGAVMLKSDRFQTLGSSVIDSQGTCKWFGADFGLEGPEIHFDSKLVSPKDSQRGLPAKLLTLFPGKTDFRAAIKWTAPESGFIRLRSVCAISDASRTGSKVIIRCDDQDVGLIDLRVPDNMSQGFETNLAVFRGAEVTLFAAQEPEGVSRTGISVNLEIGYELAPDPTVSIALERTLVPVGTNVSLNTLIKGFLNPSFQWRHQGTNLASGSDCVGVTNSVLKIENVSLHHAGEYVVVVRERDRSATSKGINLQVTSSLAEFSIWDGFSTKENPHNGWSFGAMERLGGKYTPFRLLTNFTLLPNFMSTSEGFQRWNDPSLPFAVPAVFRNPRSEPISVGTFRAAPNQIWVVPGASNWVGAIKWSAPASGEIKVDGSFVNIDKLGSSNEVTLLFKGREIGTSVVPSGVGVRGAILTNLWVNYGDELVFTVNNGEGSSWGDNVGIEIRIRYPNALPVRIETQPEVIQLPGTKSVKCLVRVVGSPPLTYQWYRDSSPLEDSDRFHGTTTSELVISNPDEKAAGNYYVKVSNFISNTNTTVLKLGN